jgi:hypothetical protein
MDANYVRKIPKSKHKEFAVNKSLKIVAFRAFKRCGYPEGIQLNGDDAEITLKSPDYSKNRSQSFFSVKIRSRSELIKLKEAIDFALKIPDCLYCEDEKEFPGPDGKMKNCEHCNKDVESDS